MTFYAVHCKFKPCSLIAAIMMWCVVINEKQQMKVSHEDNWGFWI